MIDHERALELAASTLDFELSRADDEALTAHLGSCDECRAIDSAMRADAVALVELGGEDAPSTLRERIVGTAIGADPSGSPAIASSRQARRTLLQLPDRFRERAVLVAAAAVIVAVVGGTLAWRAIPSDGGLAIVDPSGAPSDGPGTSAPPDSGGSGGPEPTKVPNDVLASTWTPVAELSAERARDGIIELENSFLLGSLDGTSPADLAGRISVQPPLTLTATPESDGRVRLTPSEPLTPGAVYRFTLAGSDGQTLDSWAFQARQPLRVVSTVPADTETHVPRDTGIEVTFDQDGVFDPAANLSIEPKVDGRFEVHDRVLAFVPAKRLAAATIYTVTIRRGVKVEATGEILEQDVRFQFETAPAKDAAARETTFRFANDLFESATADRPTISLWAYASEGDAEIDSVPLEVYRLADQAKAIDAFRQLRATPTWSHSSPPPQVPTKGLRRVVKLEAHVEEHQGTLWTRLPEPLRPGWYLVQHPSATRPAQAILQVTDIASYLLVSDTDTLVWANDLASEAPIADANVSVDGVALGRTGQDGTLVAATPAALKAERDRDCLEDCEPVAVIRDGRRSAFVPATGSRTPDGGVGIDSFWVGAEAHPKFWQLFHSDRNRYRPTDTINVWGVVRDRDSGAVPANVTIRLGAGDESDGAVAPVAQFTGATKPTGAFTGSLTLRDVPDGTYQLELVAEDTVVARRHIEVGQILKPAYRVDVVTGRRIYVVGDRIRVTATASFFEGTPVPGVPLRIDGFLEENATTDSSGIATIRRTARLSEDHEPEGPDHQTVSVRPARAEEGEIRGASHDIVVFPSMWTIAADAEIGGGRVRMSGTVNVVDRDRLERELAEGASIWDLDPRGVPVRSRTITARFFEIIPVRRQTGTAYDFIEKRVVPVYEYDQRERAAGTLRIATDDRGRFSGSIPAPAGDREYRVVLTLTDPDGHVARRTAYASVGHDIGGPHTSASIDLTDDQAGGSDFSIGDEVDLTMRDASSSGTPRDDRRLFYLAQRGLRDVTVVRSPRFVTRFPAWGPPNVEIGAVRFTGTGYVDAGRFRARFRSADRAITVDLRPDRARYAPRDEVTLAVRTRDAQGDPIAATVVLRAVDEKLFAIGAANEDDPLGELYASVEAGVRATYVSHRGPGNRGEGGDTAGGDGDDAFRDTVLFRAVETGADGRASVTFRLSDDLTSWRVGASAFGAGLEAGGGSTLVPVGLPFFIDAAIAPEYLLADRPAIQIRGFGSALDPDDEVAFAVDAPSLGVHASGLRADAFEAVTVPLPDLKLGTHSLTITASTGSGSSKRTDRLTRTFEVVASRLTRTQTTYTFVSGPTAIEGGDGITEIIVSDAGSGQELPLLVELAAGASSRLERALAADLAATLIAQRFPSGASVPAAPAFDADQYQTDDGGIAILPYASSDLETSTLAAIAAPGRFHPQRLTRYFRAIADDAQATRERRIYALAGLAGVGAPVLPEIRAAVADRELTVRERLIAGLGAVTLGDAGAARSVIASLVAEFGEGVGDQARLRVGDDAADITTATALMAMLMASTGDPVAARYTAYVRANPSREAPHELHTAGYIRWALEHRPPVPTSFAYVSGGDRRVVELGPGEHFRLKLTRAQLKALTIEPVEGAIGVTSSWREPVEATAFERDPDVTIERRVGPSGTVRARDLVAVDLKVSFGPQAATGCHRVTDLVPSGLVPVGVLEDWMDPETGERQRDRTYPEEQAAQRVTFCAMRSPNEGTVWLRYVARVITVGTYRWESAIVESRSGPNRAAITPRRELTIR